MPTLSSTSLAADRPRTLAQLRAAGWVSKTVKQEIHDNFLRKLAVRRRAVSRHHRLRRHGHPRDEHRHPRAARHAVPRRKGPGQEPADAAAGQLPRRGDPLSRRPGDPAARRPLSADHRAAASLVASVPADEVPIAWWPRDDRYAERLVPGHQVRRHHRRDRSRQAGRRREHVAPKTPCTSG